MTKGRQIKKILIMLTALLLVAGILCWVVIINSKKDDRIYATADANLQEAQGIEIITDFISEESDRRPAIQREIKWIVLHETDNRESSANASNHNNFLHTDQTQVNSWHYTVDDTQIYHHMPDNEVAWHAGDKKTEDGGNMSGIGIEMCVNRTGNYETTVENTVKLVATLMRDYQLKIEDVKFHRDFSGKVCPHRLYSEGRTSEFLRLIEKEYNELKTGETENESK